MEVRDPVVIVSNWNVGYRRVVIRLAVVMRLENWSNWRLVVENVRFEFALTVPDKRPLPPLYVRVESTKLLKNVIALTLEIYT